VKPLIVNDVSMKLSIWHFLADLYNACRV